MWNLDEWWIHWWDGNFLMRNISSNFQESNNWWVVTGRHVWIIFPEILGLCHHPNWRTHIFQRGGPTTNQLEDSHGKFLIMGISCEISMNSLIGCCFFDAQISRNPIKFGHIFRKTNMVISDRWPRGDIRKDAAVWWQIAMKISQWHCLKIQPNVHMKYESKYKGLRCQVDLSTVNIMRLISGFLGNIYIYISPTGFIAQELAGSTLCFCGDTII